MRGIPMLALGMLAACAAKPPTANSLSSIPKHGPKHGNVQLRGEVGPTPSRAQRSSLLTADIVVATIKNRYLAGVERCYRRHAKMYGASTGRVMLSFTVDHKGQTRDGSARGIARGVDGCIAAQLAHWRFPAPAKQTQFALSLAVAGG